MYNNKNSSDLLASIFSEKVKKVSNFINENKNISKTASENKSGDSDASDSMYESDAKDIMINKSNDEEFKSDSADRVKKRLSKKESSVSTNKYNKYINENTQKVLHGLGKVAGSLKSKGELFAADVVELTAKKIHLKEIRKFEKKASVINGLRKIASNLDKDGDTLSADVVRVTINKIRNS